MTASRLPTWLLAACLLVPFLHGCDRGASGSAGEQRGTLTIGLLPDESADALLARYAPLVEAIKARTGFDVQLVTPASYSEMVERFVALELDMALFGGYTFVLANERHKAVPLAMRDIDARFVSYVFVRADDTTVSSLSDLAGKRFSFGSPQSTSGHLMPRWHFAQAGIEPEDFFSEIVYSGAHDRTVAYVAEGRVDAGVANGQIVTRLLEEAPPGKKPVRIVWQSPPYVDYVWAVQPTMSEPTRRTLQQVFLDFSTADPSDRAFLASLGARYFIPADESHFHALRAAIRLLDGASAQ